MSEVLVEVMDEYRLCKRDNLNYEVQSKRVVEKGKHAGEEVWDTRGFASTGMSAHRLLTRCIISDKQGKIRKEINNWADSVSVQMMYIKQLPALKETVTSDGS